MEEFDFYPSNICPARIKIRINGPILEDTVFEGGCEGNLEAICRLVRGMPVEQVIARLKGIDCGGKGTSCPDQLASALEEHLRQKTV